MLFLFRDVFLVMVLRWCTTFDCYHTNFVLYGGVRVSYSSIRVFRNKDTRKALEKKPL